MLKAAELFSLQIIVKTFKESFSFHDLGTVVSALRIFKKCNVLTIVESEIFLADPWCWWIKHLRFGLFFRTQCAHVCLTRKSGNVEARDCCSFQWCHVLKGTCASHLWFPRKNKPNSHYQSKQQYLCSSGNNHWNRSSSWLPSSALPTAHAHSQGPCSFLSMKLMFLG